MPASADVTRLLREAIKHELVKGNQTWGLELLHHLSRQSHYSDMIVNTLRAAADWYEERQQYKHALQLLWPVVKLNPNDHAGS